jgi:hypothetical protein
MADRKTHGNPGHCTTLPEAVRLLDPLFRRSVMDVEAKDGSGRRFKIQHKFGREAGVWTILLFMKKTGVSEEMSKELTRTKARFKRDPQECAYHCKLVEKDYRTYMRGLIKAYIKWLGTKFYKEQGIEPLLEGIPINSDKDDNEWYIAGFRDVETMQPVVFISTKQVQLALCKAEKGTRKTAQKHAKTTKTIKAFARLTCVGKDMRHELDMMARGQDVPNLFYKPPSAS